MSRGRALMAFLKALVHGSVPREFVNEVMVLAHSFAESMGGPPYVELHFYGSTAEKRALIERESFDVGAIVVSDYVVMHEAWRGWSRIHIDYEACRGLSRDILEALLFHELAHAVLHGSPLHYTIIINVEELPQVCNFEEALKLVYMASTIVKDIEVCEFLFRRGFNKALRNYANFLAEAQANITTLSNLESAFNLAKLLVPCLYVEECPLIKGFSTNDKHLRLVKALLQALSEFKERGRLGDLSADSLMMAKLLVTKIIASS